MIDYTLLTSDDRITTDPKEAVLVIAREFGERGELLSTRYLVVPERDGDDAETSA